MEEQGASNMRFEHAAVVVVFAVDAPVFKSVAVEIQILLADNAFLSGIV